MIAPPTIKETAKKPCSRDSKGRFIKGATTGKGRPKGSADRRTAPFREAIDLALPEILSQLIEAAKGGDVQAARILIDKTMPNVKPTDQVHAFPLDGLTLSDKAAAIIDAVAIGALSIDEATRLLQALSSVAKIVEADELVKRIVALESS